MKVLRGAVALSTVAMGVALLAAEGKDAHSGTGVGRAGSGSLNNG